MAIEYRKFLTGAGAKEIVRRFEIVRRAVRVLDLELLCRLRKLEKHVDDIEEAGLGGHLDDYETKAEAEASHEELQTAVDGAKETAEAAETSASEAKSAAEAAMTAVDGKQDALTAGRNIDITEANVVDCTLEVEAIAVEEVDALFD